MTQRNVRNAGQVLDDEQNRRDMEETKDAFVAEGTRHNYESSNRRYVFV